MNTKDTTSSEKNPSTTKPTRADKAVRAPITKREHVSQIVALKRKWHHQPTLEEQAAGYKGWYSRGYLPHFDAKGVQQFITYRLADSVPAQLRREWNRIQNLEDAREKFRGIEKFLDRGYGACHLRDVRIAELVQNNLWFHDGTSYRLLAWVVMPNHVHLLAELWKPLGLTVKNWKSYTGSRANEVLGVHRQSFWMTDYFDRYIRDLEQYRRVVKYIENNPVKAGLVRYAFEWPWSSAQYRGKYGSDELPKYPRTYSKLSNVPPTNGDLERADKAVRAPNA